MLARLSIFQRIAGGFAAMIVVVLALALTDETRGVVDADLLAAMPSHAWLVNVARGAHVVTDDLVALAMADGGDEVWEDVEEEWEDA